MGIRHALLAVVAGSTLVAGCGEPEPAGSPDAALSRLTGYIADDKRDEACDLMTATARGQFGPENDAEDCESAVASLASQVTDKKAFREMVPSGLKVDGDTAKVSGYCRDGWTNADGSRSRLDFSPNDLGDLTLRKTDDGWKISDYRGSKRYSSCG
jgi:hypothetical protein